jgi:hypothetical protein
MESASVLIQAGHEGCPEEAGSTGPCGNEIDWTPIVADEATRILRSEGISVIRCDGNFDLPSKKYSVEAAVFLHFDGSTTHRSRASVGFPNDADHSCHLIEDAAMASQWKSLYAKYWPFGFMDDNFTNNLQRYYGYHAVTATKGKITIEFGDLSNTEQAEWLQTRLRFLGRLVAFFISGQIGKGTVELPSDENDVLRVQTPKSNEVITVGDSVVFSGEADEDVSMVKVLIGPGGPFTLGTAKPINGKWTFSQALVNSGENRPLTYQASSQQGLILQEIRKQITVLPSRQGSDSRMDSLFPWRSYYAGLNIEGARIPSEGSKNPTLEETLGVLEEPYGEIVSYSGFQFVKGRISSFGGPDDSGVSSDETGALTGELLRSLSEDDYYCAMRWCYEPHGVSFWANRRLLVINPINQQAVVVRAIDWGPNTSTGRIIDLSPKCLTALALNTDDDVICAFAKPANRAVGKL